MATSVASKRKEEQSVKRVSKRLKTYGVVLFEMI